MKIAFVFDVCNNLYNVAKAIRPLGVDVKLYVFSGRSLNTYPESDDPSVLQENPDWIIRRPNFPLFDSKATDNRDLADELSKYDLVVGSSRFVYFAHLINTKTLFFVTGSDLTELPFYFNSRNTAKISLSRPGRFIEALKLSKLARKGIRSSSSVIIDDVSVYHDSLKKLHFPIEKILKERSLLLLDMHKFSRFEEGWNKFGTEKLKKSSVKIFMPSRLLFDPQLSDKITGQWKANDIFLEGFRKCVHDLKLTSDQVQFMLLDSTMSRDVELAKKYFKQHGLEELIVWLQKPERVPFTRDELIRIYSLSDIVADDFGLGWMGSISIESMATGNYLFTYAAQSQRRYSSFPFISSNDSSKIAEALKQCMLDRNHLQAKKNECQQWVRDNHSLEAAGVFYKKLFDKILKEY